MTTGRTVSKFCKVQIADSTAVLRDLEVDSINGIGLTFPQIDLTAFQDAVKGFLPGLPDATLTFSGPLSNKAASTASPSGGTPNPTGSNSFFPSLQNKYTPLAFGVYLGIQGYWTSGDPVWGLKNSTADGILLYDYTVTPSDPPKYSATFKFYPASAAPTWGSTAIGSS